MNATFPSASPAVTVAVRKTRHLMPDKALSLAGAPRLWVWMMPPVFPDPERGMPCRIRRNVHACRVRLREREARHDNSVEDRGL